MSRNRRIDYHEFDAPEIGETPEMGPAASATELTGALLRTPATPAERQAVESLQPMEVPVRSPERRTDAPRGKA